MTEQNGTTSAPKGASPNIVSVTAEHLSFQVLRDLEDPDQVHFIEQHDDNVSDFQDMGSSSYATVVVVHDVDNDHDEVHFSRLHTLPQRNMLDETIRVLQECRAALDAGGFR